MINLGSIGMMASRAGVRVRRQIIWDTRAVWGLEAKLFESSKKSNKAVTFDSYG